MNITILDKSLYLKGLLLLASKDKKITENEKMYVMEAGRSLGFEEKFCENAVGEILENEFIEDTPPKFSSREIAKYFISDGLTIALSDYDLHAEELRWLSRTAAENHISGLEFNHLIREFLKTSPAVNFEDLNVQKMLGQTYINQGGRFNLLQEPGSRC
jgi:hypothetical protein